jgi:hypothetical protein
MEPTKRVAHAERLSCLLACVENYQGRNMPEMDKKIAANRWATSLEPGDNVPLEHELR